MQFVVCAPPYDENSGGALVLYKLYSLLREIGEEVFFHPFVRPDLVERYFHGSRVDPRIAYYRYRQRLYYNFMATSFLRFADIRDLGNPVVIYPEVVEGNPLGARRVVRWLLHQPGYHTNVVSYGPEDFFFFFDKQFDNPSLNKNPDNHLKVAENFSNIYVRRNFGARAGSCFLVRKGGNRELDYHPTGSERLDGKSHNEMADAFNRYEFFFSYDLYTMYSRFAAICGCKSIVVPRTGLSIDEWHDDPSNRYGLAYGMDDLPRADASRPALMKVMAESENASRLSVISFVKKCHQRFD
jgi:hypothetical protein